MEVYQFSLFQF